jgi:hypothetical protein
VAEADAAIERLAAAPADEGLAIRDIWLLRLRALLARAHGDVSGYADLRDRYREMAKALGYEGISPGPRRCHNGAVQRTQTAKRIGVYCRDIRALVCFGRLSEQADRKVGQIS